MLVGYARTSTIEQIAGLEAQIRDLTAATGCTGKIYSEKISSTAARGQLEAALDFVREGDTLVVTDLSRLARSTADLLSIVSRLEAKGVALRILNFGGAAVDTQSPTGKLMLVLLGAMAEWEKAIMLARQKEGIAKAKAEGRYLGRAPTARRKATQMQELRSKGLTPTAIAAELNVSRASVYRILAEQSA